METATQPEERIGDYRVHPAAAMFPLLEGQDYEDLRNSIDAYGQQQPIILLGELLLDGRNRLKVCLDLDIKPRVEQYTGSLDPVDYILLANVDRRHLTEDARAAVCTKIRLWRIEQRNAAKKAEQGRHGAAGGRGKKKTLNPKSGSGFPKRDVAAMHANSTIGQIAEQAKVSRHKAEQAVTVAKAAPELLDQVAKGEMKLKDAHDKTKAVEPKQPRQAKPRKYDAAKVAASCGRKISTWIETCPGAKRSEFKTLLLEECTRLCGR